MKFQEGKINGVECRQLAKHGDHRGWLTELFRQDELAEHQFPEMAYVSETLPGVSRGPHEHREQTDVFCFLGPGDMTLYLWDARESSPTRGVKMKLPVGESHPCQVIIPPGVVHAYKNTSEKNALVFNAPNRLFAGRNRECPVDEIRHEEDENSPFLLD
ncbi:MAG: dTDP-4-dehydrorhamnose 3,5-epimerase family protein [Planctomycetaceae bacterium]|nr:dTDP-4-dehydrorhamnose 3,5-epimerase family protein [Planctomycetaceae bacterium]